MATALLGGLIAAGKPVEDLCVVEPQEAVRNALHDKLGICCYCPVELEQLHADAVVWAVKPQHLKDAAVAAPRWMESALHISIAAGVQAKTLSGWLNAARVIRAMPNSPTLVGLGCTGLYALEAASDADRCFTGQLFAQSGSIFWLDSEPAIDAITAVSGSGPAYVFQFLEALQKAAENLGFPPLIARQLVLETAIGACHQAAKTQEDFTSLRMQVTSEKGTTAAALAVLEQASINEIYATALQAAQLRAAEIGAALSMEK